MAEFSPELEDGERWLPADILKDVGARHPYDFTCPAPSGGRECFPRLAYLNTLARELASLGIFHHPAVSSPSLFSPSPHYFVFDLPLVGLANNAVRFGAVRDGLTGASIDSGGGASGSLLSVQTPVGSDRFPSPFQRHCSVFCQDPDQLQTPFGACKAGIMHRPTPAVRDRFASIPTAGPARESAGTGVFIPRVKVEKVNATQGCREQSEKKQGTRNGREKERAKRLRPALEHGLPQDWTY
ncbi:uncharacterized protein LOC122037396 isoform X2 [Zingiber officinale]|uniref:uncharacterized protein LOC122037396 isoform X2 n=1 Tax=Zingiber officinale TaxID=94328 RepID=UPI001C4CFF91|nr:uncharacterized protein LOC122037396 isoform X2 [Zingiber officinale]